MLGKNTILKAIHNEIKQQEKALWVWMLGKNTILKAIHNGYNYFVNNDLGVNAG